VVKLWSLVDGKQLASLTHVSAVFTVRFNADGTRMLASSGDSTATLWDVPRRLRLGRIDTGGDVSELTFTKDGYGVTTDSVGGVYVWDGRADNISTAFSDHGAEVWSVAFAPAPGMVATYGADNWIRRWRLADAKETGRVATNMDQTFLQRIAFLPDGRLIGPHDFHAGVWSSAGERIGQLQTLFLQAATTDPHGRVAVANGFPIEDRYQVVLWDVDHERPVKYLQRAHQAYGLMFDSSGSRLAISDSGGVAAWDVEHDSVLWEAPGPSSSHVAFSADGRLIAATSTDGYVRIRDALTGVVLQTLKQEGRALCVAFSPGGDLFATAVSNNRIYLWDIATGKPAGVLIGHENVINDLAFTPDGKQLVSASRDGRALVWDVRYEQRSADEIARIVAERAPFHLVGSDLINNDPNAATARLP
jgi:WD40 repeat protein